MEQINATIGFKHVISGLALAAMTTGAMAREPLIRPDERPYLDRGICLASNVAYKKPHEMKACTNYVVKSRLTTDQLLSGVSNTCLARYRTKPLERVRCATELAYAYNLVGDNQTIKPVKVKETPPPTPASVAAPHQIGEPEIQNSELPYVRGAVCSANNMRLQTEYQRQQCRDYYAYRSSQNNFTDEENIAVIKNICGFRYSGKPEKDSQRCYSDLMTRYNLVAKDSNEGTSNLEACAIGAVITVGAHVLLNIGGLILDGMGCAGACVTTTMTYSATTGVIDTAMGCTAGITSNMLGRSNNGKSSRPRPH